MKFQMGNHRRKGLGSAYRSPIDLVRHIRDDVRGHSGNCWSKAFELGRQ
jgi:hypothetical protein